MAEASKTALVAGATGVVGQTVLEKLSGDPDWLSIGLARRRPEPAASGLFLEADLLDPATLHRHGATLGRVTHVFFTTRLPAADPATEAHINSVVLGNLLDALDAAGADLRHVCLVHGTKWYGCHLGPYRTPAEETDPRHSGSNFYFSQHDLVSERQKGRSWTWSTLRPHTVWGYSAGSGNSLVNAIGVYAALAREAGMALHFPGPETTYQKCSQGITAELLAEALIWTTSEGRCAGQDFNVTNGDTFRWERLWPRVAELFGMECGAPRPAAMDEIEALAPELWPKMATKCRLARPDVDRLASWSYLRGLFGMSWDDWSSLEKIRHYGFTAALDSEQTFLSCLTDLGRAGIIPALSRE